MFFKRIIFGLICFICLIGCQTNNADDFVEATLLYVIDGDTIEVQTEDEELRIRMIGIDTPESVNMDESKNCENGVIASDYVKSLLSENQIIWLEFDEDRQDDYGRTLAYVWLSNEIDTNNFDDFKNYNVGAIIMQNTYCRSIYYAPNGKYRSWYDQLDQKNYIVEE